MDIENAVIGGKVALKIKSLNSDILKLKKTTAYKDRSNKSSIEVIAKGVGITVKGVDAYNIIGTLVEDYEDEVKRLKIEFEGLNKNKVKKDSSTMSLAEIALSQGNHLPMLFGKTADRLENKVVTRRIWADKHIKIMKYYAQVGSLVPAYRKHIRNGGKQIGWILIKNICEQRLGDLTKEDVEKEGYPDLSKNEFLSIFFPNIDLDTMVYVVEFKYEPLS
ncbi:MAG: hypothetical protein QM504_08035 [Pseudomonadota bacterium]